jgi:hypothetical protein
MFITEDATEETAGCAVSIHDLGHHLTEVLADVGEKKPKNERKRRKIQIRPTICFRKKTAKSQNVLDTTNAVNSTL